MALRYQLLKAQMGDEPIGDTFEMTAADLKSAAAEALKQLAQHQMQAFRECRANAPERMLPWVFVSSKTASRSGGAGPTVTRFISTPDAFPSWETSIDPQDHARFARGER